MFKTLEKYQAFMNLQIGCVFSLVLLIFSFIKRKQLGLLGRGLVFLGKISFSLYLCHGIVFHIAEYFLKEYNVAYMIVMYPISVGLAYLSTLYVEPILTRNIEKFTLSKND